MHRGFRASRVFRAGRSWRRFRSTPRFTTSAATAPTFLNKVRFRRSDPIDCNFSMLNSAPRKRERPRFSSRRFSSQLFFSPQVGIASTLAGGAVIVYYLYNHRTIAHAEIEAAPEVSETAAEAAFAFDGVESLRESSFRWIDVTNDNFEQILPQVRPR
jgi:hypothetical protein